MTSRARHAHGPTTMERSWLWLLITFLLAMILALALAPAAAGAPQESSRDYSLFNRGSISYQRYCSNCHGPKAKGDGQVARLLTVKPTDLTELALNNQGEFPEEEVRKFIDGRKSAAGHGMRDMPIWGDVFLDGGEGPDAEARVTTKIDELVTYLRGIQEK